MRKGKFFIAFLILVLLLTAWSPAPVTAAGTATPIKLSIVNKTGATTTVTLTGPASYSVVAKSGKTLVNVLPGKYRYSYKACGGTKSGTTQVKKNGDQLILAACPKKKGPSTSKLTVSNKTGRNVIMTMSGPTRYTFTFPPGTTKVDVQKGKYTWTAWGCGGHSTSGKVNMQSSKKITFWCIH